MQVLRGKGFFWLSIRSDMGGELGQAGGVARVSCAGPWFAAMPEEVWPDVDVSRPVDTNTASGQSRPRAHVHRMFYC